MPHSLTHPERLTITGPQGETYQGGDQEWYRDLWQRRAGCGPTTAAALLSYLSQTRPGLRPMAPAAAMTAAHPKAMCLRAIKEFSFTELDSKNEKVSVILASREHALRSRNPYQL